MSDDAKRLSVVVLEALTMRDQLKAAGVTGRALEAGFEQVVRDAWPHVREWHYLCEACNDTGLRLFVCRKGQRCNGVSTRTDGPHDTPGRYQRLCAKSPESEYEHDYGEPCYCKRGARFVIGNRSDRQLEEASAQKKPTRWGR